MPTWPVSLPEVRPGGYQETPQNQVLRSEMETGPAKTRRRFTAGTRTIPVQYQLTDAELAVFEAFFDDEIAAGALSFSWPHPRTGQTVTAKILPPGYQIDPVGGGLWWLLSLTIEVQP